MRNNRSQLLNCCCVIAFLLIAGTVFSQQFIVDKIKSYNNRIIQEKLFVHTDKEFYIAGEILWFKIYYAEGTTHRPLQFSNVAYVDILNEKNEPVMQGKISLKPEESKGSFYLPTSLNSGNYTLRAYTNWMKNFGPEYFFRKKITIVNTLKVPEAGIPGDSDTAFTINFFPEGGNLVNDIESKVGFIIENNRGGINNCQGYIIDNNNDTVTTFSPLKFGIGNFTFKPTAGNTYRATVVLKDGAVITRALPKAYENGYVMNVKDNNNDQVKVTIQRKRMAGEGNAEQITLIAYKGQILDVAEKASLNDNSTAVFLVDKKRIGEGVTYLTLFNNNNKPLCERLIYIRPKAGVALDVKSDHGTYATRQLINLSLEAQNSEQNKTPLNLSASVFKVDELQKPGQSTIVDYMWLSSDIAGTIESPEYYFSNDPNVKEATDNLMLTQGWRRFKWDDVLAGNNDFIKFLPEINGQLLTGRIRDTRNDKPVSNTDAYLSIPGHPFGFYSSRSDENGFVHFEVKDYYGNRQVIAQPGIGADSFYRVEIMKPFAEAGPTVKNTFYQLREEVKDELLQKSIGMQVQNVYSGDSLRNFIDPVLSDTLPFYGKPEMEYKLDNYKRFTTMEEVLREYVAEIGVVVKNGKLVLKIFNPDAHDFYDGSELVLLDGVPLPNMNKIFSYDPLKIKKLEVVQTRYVLGQSVFNGVASFSTYDGVFDGFELDPRLIAIDYAGLQLQREFYSPVYQTKEQLANRIPDFRNTLLWAPDITTDKDGKAAIQFYSSDRTGKYIVVLQGISKNGDVVSALTTFEVK